MMRPLHPIGSGRARRPQRGEECRGLQPDAFANHDVTRLALGLGAQGCPARFPQRLIHQPTSASASTTPLQLSAMSRPILNYFYKSSWRPPVRSHQELLDKVRQHLAAPPSDRVAANIDAHIARLLASPPFAPLDPVQWKKQQFKYYITDPVGMFLNHLALGTATMELGLVCLNRVDRLGVQGGTRIIRGLVKAGLLAEPADMLLPGAPPHRYAMAALLRDGELEIVIQHLLRDPAHLNFSWTTLQVLLGAPKMAELVWPRIYVVWVFSEETSERRALASAIFRLSVHASTLNATTRAALAASSTNCFLDATSAALVRLRLVGDFAPTHAILKGLNRNPHQTFTNRKPEVREFLLLRLGMLSRECLALGMTKRASWVTATMENCHRHLRALSPEKKSETHDTPEMKSDVEEETPLPPIELVLAPG